MEKRHQILLKTKKAKNRMAFKVKPNCQK